MNEVITSHGSDLRRPSGRNLGARHFSGGSRRAGCFSLRLLFLKMRQHRSARELIGELRLLPQPPGGLTKLMPRVGTSR